MKYLVHSSQLTVNSKVTINRELTNQLTNNQQGFTLVEVLVAATISVMAGVLLLGILISSTGVFYQQNAKVDQGVGSNDALLEFRRSLKEASSVAIAYPETGIALHTSGSGEIVIKLASINNLGNIVAGIYDYEIFYKNEDKLYLKVIPSDQSTRQSFDKILTSNVQTVLFQYLDENNQSVNPIDSDKVKMTLTLRQKAGAIYETNIATSEANLRND